MTDSRYVFSPKLLIFINPDAPEIEETSQLDVDVFYARLDDKDILVRPDSGTLDGENVLTNPLVGPCVVLRPSKGGRDVDKVVLALWSDARLDKPKILSLNEWDAIRVFNTLQGAQAALVTNASRRNVQLLNQIVALRQKVEDLSVFNESLTSELSDRNNNSHLLVYQSRRTNDDRLELKGGETVSQLVPITALPAMLGGLSVDVDGLDGAKGTLGIRVDCPTSQEVFFEGDVLIERQRSVAFVPFLNKVSPGTRRIEVHVTNKSDPPFFLGTALQQSPDEGIRLSEKDQSDAIGSLALDLYSIGPNAASAFNAGTRRTLPAWDAWLNSCEKVTPGFKERNWMHTVGRNSVLLHPLPNNFAVGKFSLTTRRLPYIGARAKVSLDKKAVSAVHFRIIAVKEELKFNSTTEIKKFVEGVAIKNGELARSKWITVLPGTTQVHLVDFVKPSRGSVAYIVSTTRGQSVEFAHFLVSDMQIVIEE